MIVRISLNAAKFLLDAAAAQTLTADQTKLIHDLANEPGDIRSHFDEMRTIVESNSNVFDLVHQARGLPDVDWGVRIVTPALSPSPKRAWLERLTTVPDLSYRKVKLNARTLSSIKQQGGWIT